MKILKNLLVMVFCCGLFLCGSGFSNDYEDIQMIELKFNPTTGYSWNVTTVDLELEHKGKVDVIQTDNCDNGNDSICGADGTVTFFIKGVETGEVCLSFKYKRPWEISQYDREVLALLDVNESGKVKILAYYDGAGEKLGDFMDINLK